MKDLLLYMAKSLVDDPDSVTVTEVEGETTVLELRVAEREQIENVGFHRSANRRPKPESKQRGERKPDKKQMRVNKPDDFPRNLHSETESLQRIFFEKNVAINENFAFIIENFAVSTIGR